jgi:hypothetical protein
MAFLLQADAGGDQWVFSEEVTTENEEEDLGIIWDLFAI